MLSLNFHFTQIHKKFRRLNYIYTNVNSSTCFYLKGVEPKEKCCSICVCVAEYNGTLQLKRVLFVRLELWIICREYYRLTD